MKRSNIAVALEDVEIAFSGRVILKDLNFFAEKGRVTSILGLTGSGKTQILRLIAGIQTPTTGKVVVSGRREGAIGWASQVPAIFPWLSVRENLKIFIDDDSEVDELIQRFDLVDYLQQKVAYLSGGTRQKMNLIRAFNSKNELILLDEPFNGLDVGSKRYFRDMIAKLQSRHKLTVVMVTHDLEDSFYMSNRVCLLSKKKKGIVLEEAVSSESLSDESYLSFKRKFEKLLVEDFVFENN